jgi:hypothetical protein
MEDDARLSRRARACVRPPRHLLWRPRFLISIISANDLVNQVKHVDFDQTLVNLGHHLENLANIH